MTLGTGAVWARAGLAATRRAAATMDTLMQRMRRILSKRSAGCAGRAQPDRHVRGLHRVVDHVAELAHERVEVDLLAQAQAEAVQRPRGVVAAPVEAAVDERLYARAHRAEQGGDGERGT